MFSISIIYIIKCLKQDLIGRASFSLILAYRDTHDVLLTKVVFFSVVRV